MTDITTFVESDVLVPLSSPQLFVIEALRLTIPYDIGNAGNADYTGMLIIESDIQGQDFGIQLQNSNGWRMRFTGQGEDSLYDSFGRNGGNLPGSVLLGTATIGYWRIHGGVSGPTVAGKAELDVAIVNNVQSPQGSITVKAGSWVMAKLPPPP